MHENVEHRAVPDTALRDAWSELDSRRFIDMGRVMIPGRDEIERAILALLPARDDEEFTVVDIAAGAGWLSRAILERFPRSRTIVLDGSSAMLEEARRTLARLANRFELRGARLEDARWLDAFAEPVRCFVSSLAIHHLDDAGKRDLFTRLHTRLEPGGALLVADIVQPASECALRYAAKTWHEEVCRQSLERAGNTDAYDFFVRERWNIFEHPDPADRPSTIAEQLAWLRDIGFDGVDVFWVRAGHALYGGYKGSNRRKF